MILPYLILAHLLGDFVFQPSSLAMWKMKSMAGTLVHVLVHFAINLIILLPFLVNGYYWLIYVVAGICVTHFLIDEAKINYDLKHDKKVKPFVIDQLLHIITLLAANFFLSDVIFSFPANLFYKFYTNSAFIIFLSFLVLATTVVEIYNFQKLREKNAKAKLKLHSRQMLNRVIVFTLIYALFMFVALLLSN